MQHPLAPTSCVPIRKERIMFNEDSNWGAKEQTVLYGGGLSGMVAAYINARALEDDAAHNANWRAEQAFRPDRRGWVHKLLAPRRRGGAATVS